MTAYIDSEQDDKLIVVNSSSVQYQDLIRSPSISTPSDATRVEDGGLGLSVDARGLPLSPVSLSRYEQSRVQVNQRIDRLLGASLPHPPFPKSVVTKSISQDCLSRQGLIKMPASPAVAPPPNHQQRLQQKQPSQSERARSPLAEPLIPLSTSLQHTHKSPSSHHTGGVSPSACFVHSHLDHSINHTSTEALANKSVDQGSHLASGLSGHARSKKKKKKSNGEGGDVPKGVTAVNGEEVEDEDEVDDDDSGTASDGQSGQNSAVHTDDDGEEQSLTRRLAETAVSVREMSKQLGQARVVSHVQSVMIITKARDNQLIRLTRELALWLMQTPRDGRDRGLVVYVDSQLRKSKRFDAEGIARDSPELFRPLPRRYSRSSSSASLSGSAFLNNSGTTSPSRNANPNHHIKQRMTPLSQLTETVMKRSLANSDHSRSKSGDMLNGADEGQLRYWTSEMCTKSSHLFDFVITLGGDGTVLYASWLFQRIVPPVIPFALGSLGFLTNFDFPSYVATLNNAIDRGIRVNLRMRFTCTVYRAIEGEECMKRRAVRSGKTGGIFMNSLTRDGWEVIESGGASHARETGRAGQDGKDKEIKCFSTRPVETFEVLNDLVVDRGPSPYVSLLELFGDEHHMTTVQADGLTVSTPTGSTAYSLSAGGSLVHPEVPALLVTPICPHTLSFRPMLLPDSMELRIVVPYNSRSTAWASFDGRGRVELRQGDHIKVTASQYPFPTVCADKQSTDWFHSIARTLKWNERQRQKSFVILEQSRDVVGEGVEGQFDPVVSNNTAKNAASKDKTQSLQAGRKAKEGNRSVSQKDDEDDDYGATGVEHYDIDDLSQADDSSPTSTAKDPVTEQIPMLATADRQTYPHESDEKMSAFQRKRENSTFSSSSELKDDNVARFRDPAPHPPKLSSRHSQNEVPEARDPPAPTNPSPKLARTPNLNSSNLQSAPQHHRLSASTARRRERGEEGDRDHIREPLSVKRTVGGGSRRLVKSKDPGTSTEGFSRSEPNGQRAFAVVGADSDTSDSDAE